jgi:hypothetical protein
MADLNRQTQDWTFPKSEVASTIWVSSPAEPLKPASDTVNSRVSTASLIDLDASIVSDLEIRSSTPHSEDTLGGSENENTLFHIDFIGSAGKPSTHTSTTVRPNREPSLYVPDDMGMYPSIINSENGDD